MISSSKKAVCICGVGARTPLGLNALTTAAAVRAAISAVAIHPIFVDKAGENMCVAHDALLDPFISVIDRFLTLLSASLQEVLEGIATVRRGVPVTFIIGLPEPRPGLPHDLDQMLARRLREISEIVTSADPIHMLPHGHAAGLMAIQAAAQKITDGQTEVCVVAGVESYLNPDTLEWLAGSDRKIELFEFVLQKIVLRHLASKFGDSPPTAIQFYTLKPLVPDCAVILSALANVGSSQQFWYIATSSITPADAATVKGFTNATWKLNTDGTLVYQVAAVPVPAAAWLFASGILGLVGVARRRLQS